MNQASRERLEIALEVLRLAKTDPELYKAAVQVVMEFLKG